MELDKFTDDFGPEICMEVYDAKTGMRGLVLIDNTALGPGKGGIRMEPWVDEDEIFNLARTMTWKTALAELPFGGAKSGIIADPKKMIKQKKMEIVSAFSRALKSICPSLYVAAPDMNMGEEEMAIFAKENGDMRACTGKPEEMGGIPHEIGSTGFGVYHAALVAAEHIGLDIKGTSVAVEGFGNVGSFVAKFITERGAKLIAASDSKGCIYNPDGLNFEQLSKVKEKTLSVINYKPGRILNNEKLFEIEVDILIPAAIPNVITNKNVNKVKAKIISEGSNIPIPHNVEKTLNKKGVLIIPDFVANAGGVISSYVEYFGGKQEDVFKLIEEKITRNTKIILNHAKIMEIDTRTAALQIAKDRVKDVIDKRGV